MSDFTKALFDRLKCVIIETPIEVLDNSLCKDLFYKIIQLKVEGFDIIKSKYLALDQNDFLVTHIAMCDETSQGYRPLMAFKIMGQNHALKWNLPFCMPEIAKKTQSDLHIAAVEHFMHECASKKRNVAYPGSMTISPLITERSMREEFIQIFQALLTFYHKEYYPSSSICMARSKVKSADFLKEMGFSYLKDANTKNLPAFNYKPYLNEEMRIMCVKDDFSSHAYEMLTKYRHYLNARIEIAANENSRSLELVPNQTPSKISA